MSQNYSEQQKDLQTKGQEAVNTFKNFIQQNYHSAPLLIGLFTIIPLAAFLLFLSGLAFMGSLVGLCLATPVFIFFSPVIVPAVLAIGLAVIGFFVSGAFGITGLSALSWIINFIRYRVRGVDDVMQRAHDAAEYVGQRVKDVGHDVSEKARETSRT
ncbi:hypothetical protein RND81_10G230600 [Saponaria officinalis]|uniref:Oleosin n=1 Tax=Saponaria officinalis TaxID=3572 RepID=A0AAW1I5K2_SAPOF